MVAGRNRVSIDAAVSPQVRLSHCSEETVAYVVENMRASDKQEIYGLRRSEEPGFVVNDVMAMSNFAWVAWLDTFPQAVFGGGEVRPGVWSMFAFATDEFPRLALGLTRFAKHTVIPTLFGELGAHRLQCESHESHISAHKWLRLLGSHRESVLQGYGKDGSNYHQFVILKQSTNPTNQSILANADVSIGARRAES